MCAEITEADDEWMFIRSFLSGIKCKMWKTMVLGVTRWFRVINDRFDCNHAPPITSMCVSNHEKSHTHTPIYISSSSNPRSFCFMINLIFTIVLISPLSLFYRITLYLHKLKHRMIKKTVWSSLHMNIASNSLNIVCLFRFLRCFSFLLLRNGSNVFFKTIGIKTVSKYYYIMYRNECLYEIFLESNRNST